MRHIKYLMDFINKYILGENMQEIQIVNIKVLVDSSIENDKNKNDNVILDSVINSLMNRPSKEFLIKDSNNIHSIKVNAFVDMRNGFVLYSKDSNVSYILCSFEKFFDILDAIVL